jgi:pilus assembly protein CpaE
MYFDLNPNYNIADMARREAGMDSVFVDSVVAEHSSHVSILAAPTQLDDFNLINAAKLDHVLKLLRNEFDCIILDAPWDFDEFSLRAIDMSNETLIVSTPDVMSVTHARVQRESMQRLGASPDRIHTLLNRVSKSQTLTRKQMEEYLGGSITAEIPDAPVATRESADEGQILREVQGSQDILQAIAGLRAHVCDWCKLETQEGRSAKADAGFVAKFRGLIRRKPNGTA